MSHTVEVLLPPRVASRRIMNRALAGAFAALMVAAMPVPTAGAAHGSPALLTSPSDPPAATGGDHSGRHTVGRSLADDPGPPYIAVGPSQLHLGPISTTRTYLSIQPDAQTLLLHLEADGKATRDVKVFDVEGRRLIHTEGTFKVLPDTPRYDTALAKTVRVTFGSAADRLVSAGCTSDQVTLLRIPADVPLERAAAQGMEALEHFRGESRPHSEGAARDLHHSGVLASDDEKDGHTAGGALDACLVKINGDSSHYKNWLHNLWHRVSG